MIEILANRTYRHLFAAQIFSLIGTGLTTVALGLLAYDLAGANAGAVLGTALALKMIAYVGIAPIAGPIAAKLPRRSLLVTLDAIRAGFVLLLPFVTEIWQIYALVFLFQACSAVFTPTFQATIPDILSDEQQYTRALSLSRLAYDLESLVSPLLAGVLLTVITFQWLFVGTTLGFLASAALVVSAGLPTLIKRTEDSPFRERVLRGLKIYLKTPRLKALLALHFAVSAAGAMVIVNTVVHVRADLGGDDSGVALLFAAYGLGSMAVALLLPRLFDRLPPRTIMLPAGAILVGLLVLAPFANTYAASAMLWTAFGAAISGVATPGGLLLRRSSHSEDRPALFSAHFALSHAGWLITYPLAGWLGAGAGLDATFLVMAALGLVAVGLAASFWPRPDRETLDHYHPPVEHTHRHVHDDEHHQHEHEGWEGPEPHSHPHRHGPLRHAHPFVIDDHHLVWPNP